MMGKRIMAAARTRGVKYAIRDIVVLAEEIKRAGREPLYLNIGDPVKFDFQTPPHILEAIYQGMLQGATCYAPSEGIEEAVAAIEREAKAKGIDHICKICVTMGSGEGIELALSALLNPWENVLLPAPGYPLYPAIMSRLNADVIHYYLNEENGWQPDPDEIEAKITVRTRAILVINPHNPTGSVTSEETLRRIVDIARRNNLVILADEIYDKLLYNDQKHVSLAALAGDQPCITFNGLAKSYAAPGLKTGWAIISGDKPRMEDFVEGFMKMARSRLCANTPSQWGIQPALEGDQSSVKQMIERLEKRAELVVSRLNAIEGFHCVPPQGAFYVFPTIAYKGSDWDFVKDLLKATGVVCVPGTGFGQMEGTKHIRLTLLPPEPVLSRAMDHIEDFVRKSL